MNDDTDDIFSDLLEACKEVGRTKKAAQQVRIFELIREGLIIPPVELWADYTPDENNPARKTYRLRATILRDGALKVDDRIYRSLSMAASMAQQRIGAKPQVSEKNQVNGWEFWSFRDPGTGSERKIADVRQEYIRKTGKG